MTLVTALVGFAAHPMPPTPGAFSGENALMSKPVLFASKFASVGRGLRAAARRPGRGRAGTSIGGRPGLMLRDEAPNLIGDIYDAALTRPCGLRR